jgi:hypothetical protein
MYVIRNAMRAAAVSAATVRRSIVDHEIRSNIERLRAVRSISAHRPKVLESLRPQPGLERIFFGKELAGVGRCRDRCKTITDRACAHSRGI